MRDGRNGTETAVDYFHYQRTGRRTDDSLSIYDQHVVAFCHFWWVDVRQLTQIPRNYPANILLNSLFLLVCSADAVCMLVGHFAHTQGALSKTNSKLDEKNWLPCVFHGCPFWCAQSAELFSVGFSLHIQGPLCGQKSRVVVALVKCATEGIKEENGPATKASREKNPLPTLVVKRCVLSLHLKSGPVAWPYQRNLSV